METDLAIMYQTMKFALTAVAFLAASLLPPIVMALSSPLSGKLSVQGFLGDVMLLYPFSLFAILVLGLPTFLLLRRFAPGRWWWVMPTGFALGMCVAVVIGLPNFPRASGLLQMGLLGAGSALVFWLIWRRGQAGSA